MSEANVRLVANRAFVVNRFDVQPYTMADYLNAAGYEILLVDTNKSMETSVIIIDIPTNVQANNACRVLQSASVVKELSVK